MVNMTEVLENITEAIRYKRRFAPIFMKKLDIQSVVYNEDLARIEIDILDNGQVRKFDLLVDEVQNHGDTTEVVYDEVQA